MNQEHWWHVRVDAQTGELLDQTDWVSQCNVGPGSGSHAGHNHTIEEFTSFDIPNSFVLGAIYNVFAIPVESPSHGARSIVVDPENLSASPYGWHDTNGQPGVEFTTTRGNNVYASEDRNANDQLGYSPDGGSALDFDFPLNLNLQPQANEDAAITNLFYMNNIMHDVWYNYGFDEASGNFQQNNYGNGGLGNDHVFAQAQDGGGTNNANFATPPDGSNPTMQMYLWSAPTPSYLTVNSPSTVSGQYQSIPANFGPAIPTTPITADLVIYDDNTANPTEACSPAVNAGALNGKIAVIRRGTCSFVDKVANAEAAGALAVIIVNNVGGIITMGGTAAGLGLPSLSVTMDDGEALITEIENGATVNATIVDASSVQLDGDFDNGIVAHEYGHGISIRLTGGASNSSCLNNREQMGEGWSDWFALMLTIEPGDQPEDVRGIGTYAIGETPMGGGIRPRPYSTDFNINEMTYAATNNTGAISQPHGIGFVWATMLWDLTWALIDKHGMDPDVYNGTGGNNIAMHLVIQGLKLQGSNPGFVDGRDAILQADQLLYNGENTCLIWEVFANRGLGFSADQGSRNSRTDQTEAFDLPPFVGSTYSTETITACESYTWPTNNQEYTTSGSYNAYLLNENGCDSIVTLDLTITASETSTITEVACGSYTWSANNQTYFNSGVYTETLTTVSGCDSIVTLDLTISNSQSPTVTEEVCGSYTWSANSQTYTTSGVYTETLATVEGCDSVVTLDLTISSQSVSTTVTEEVCGSYTWSANNQTYTSSGVYTETLATVEGCDSIVTLDLTISGQAVSTTVTEEVCGSYTWSANNQTYTSSGVYTETLATVEGCDSVVTLDLTINNQSVSTTVTEEVCGSYTWSANNQTYTSSGVYTETLATVGGCDSIVTLDLTISNSQSSTVTEEVCGSYTWSANSQTYTSSGVYTETLATVEGCDSVVTLDLTISGQAVSTTVTEEACGSYTWSANNQTYTSSGVYTETLATVGGCDSIVSLDLTIMDIVTDLTIDFENNALVSSPNYSSYQWVNCDENYAPISGEVNSTFTPSSNGNYAVIITNGNCVDTSVCMRINILDLYNHEKNSMKIYPNPTGGLVKIEFVEPFSQGKISVYEMTGKLVQEFNIENQKQFQFILEGETGVYIIEHQTALGIVNRQRITKLN